MNKIFRFLSHPAFHMVALTVLLGFVFAQTRLLPQDDHGHYQRFIQALARGDLDLSILGFHGSSFLALPVYLLWPTPYSNAHFQILCALLLPAAAYAAVAGLFKDRIAGILFAYAMAMMPFFSFVAFGGYTFPSAALLMLLTILLRSKGSAWAALPWAFAILTKPFAVALLPLFLLWQPKEAKSKWGNGWTQVLLMLPLPILYVALQYLQVGHIIVGAHEDITQENVFLWWRAPLNAIHGVQMLFSVHNFYFPVPGKTGMANLVHSSPLPMIFGVMALLYPALFWKDVRLARAVGASVIAAYVLAALLDHMDHYYMQTVVLMLALSSVPLLLKFRLLIPLALGTLHFQFLYLYLEWKGAFFTDYSIFLIPLGADLLALVSWAALVLPHWQRGRAS